MSAVSTALSVAWIGRRPALEGGETIAQLGVVAAHEHDGHFEMGRCGAYRRRVAKPCDRYQERTSATHCRNNRAEYFGINTPALRLRKESNSYGTCSEDSFQLRGPIQVLDWIDGRYWIELHTVVGPGDRQHLIVADLVAMAACRDQSGRDAVRSQLGTGRGQAVRGRGHQSRRSADKHRNVDHGLHPLPRVKRVA